GPREPFRPARWRRHDGHRRLREEESTVNAKAADPRSHLPLTPLAFQVLLALAEGPRHGYGIMSEVNERSGGTANLRTGTLYTLLQRLTDAGLVEESADRPAADEDDDRRRYCQLTELGRDVLAAEARR